MENKQTTESTAQDEPLNNQNNAQNSNDNSAARSRNERINKIKQKFLPGFKITLLLSLAIYIAMLVIGILAVHKCPVEENIPLFLIASGAIGLITKILTYLRERILKHFKVGYVESSLYTIETAFLILGCYWVYKEYPPSYDPADKIHYCQKTAYKFAFVYVTFILAVCLIAITGFLCFLGCICFLAKTSSDDVEAQTTTARTGEKDNEGEGNGS